ncbi:TPA: phospholipase D-like domain-containing protein, partial [Bacillus thuringiensis]|nr:hypothetical protein [Bacillus thuringiensis]HDR7232552.1 hypothetical protein [Bacillus cereus]HDR6338905.1 hypothetical protein [Bacillus thuringiensis]HDR6345361.1 hypothetical protein [Bacillus thuringiensis]HDR6351751.1 hypothetical protein [Bacillus thuringiensis]
SVEELSKVEKKESLYIASNIENIAQLRYLDSLENNLKELGFPIPIHFDWWQLLWELDEKKPIPDITFNNFKNYLYTLSQYLNTVIEYVKEQYESIGRLELLKRIKVIK